MTVLDPVYDSLLEDVVTRQVYTPTAPPTFDDHGGVVATWVPANAITPAFVQPRVVTEIRDGRQVVLSTHDCFVGPAATFSEQDRVAWGGRAYQIISILEEYEPEGLHHKILTLLGVSGT